MQEVIEKSIQLTSLLQELQKSTEFEKSAYHLVKDTSFGMNVFLLISLPNKTTVKCGRIESIKSYINLRKIDVSTITMDKDYLTTQTTTTNGKT